MGRLHSTRGGVAASCGGPAGLCGCARVRVGLVSKIKRPSADDITPVPVSAWGGPLSGLVIDQKNGRLAMQGGPRGSLISVSL
jgi:hypothetical protein